VSVVPHIVVLTADTGGGHRSVSEALVEAFEEAAQTDVETVDVFKYVPWPFSQIPRMYLPTINHASMLWGASYGYFNNRVIGNLYLRILIDPVSQRGMRRLYAEHTPSLVVSTHPLFQFTAARILHKQMPGIPFVSMITDFASAHRWWFTRLTDLCLLPSDDLRPTALACGVAAKKIYVTGLPVHRSFSMNRYISRQEARTALGLENRTTLLLVGGGEGMGALREMAFSIEREFPDLQLLIIAGRNKALKAALDARTWKSPTRVYGFVKNMPQLMRAADVLVTKAGPSTLSEALICGLPTIISGYVPGQEEGNVRFILNNRAGYFLERGAGQLTEVLKELLANEGARLAEVAQNAYALGRPDAAREAVRLIMQLYQIAQQTPDS
jgi:1,2-diacylglycerol 3-beta-galactosyltransferase